MSRRSRLGTMVALALLRTFALAGIGGAFAATPAVSVTIQNFAFRPADASVGAG